MNIIALIPARSGSKRVPGKNVRPLAGHPMLFYTIAAARESGIFDGIYVSSDDPRICYMAELRGATPVPRPPEFATDTSPDIEWIDHFFRTKIVSITPYGFGEKPIKWEPIAVGYDVVMKTITADAFAILRPTSPFRSAETIRRAWQEFQEKQPCDSIRAVEKGPNPWKMWFYRDEKLDWFNPSEDGHWRSVINGKRMHEVASDEQITPLHSMPSQMAPTLYMQNASLEISWTRNVTENCSISGDVIKPFFTQGYEGFDVNTEEDFILAEALIERGLAKLPGVK